MSEDLSSLNSQQLDQHISSLENKLESVGINPNPDKPAPAEKPTLFSHASDAKLSSELGAIYDKSEAREERKPEMPAREGEKLGDRVERAAEWNALSKAERKLQSDASNEVTELKETAAKYNLTLAEAEQLKQSELLKSASSEYGPTAEHLRSAFSDRSPSDAAKFVSDIKRSADQDLPGTVAWMAESYGRHPMEIAMEIARRYGNQPQQPQNQTQALAAVEREIAEAASHLPNFKKYEDGIEEVLRQPSFKRSGNYRQDLVNAYKAAVRADAKLTPDDRLTREMSKIYDRKAGAK